MKPNAYITGLAALSLATTAYADVTINITGATAFRSATLTAIKAQYDIGNGGVSYKYAHDKAAGGTNFNGSKRSIWVGKFPGITGTTTIRCCFTGSVEGVRALNLTGAVDPAPPTYYPVNQLDTTTANNPGVEVASPTVVSPGLETLSTTSDIAFSDVNLASTPYTGSLLSNDRVGVIVFSMVSNEGSSISSVTSQQYRAVLSKGQPLSLFTGNPANTTKVYAVGRNDGSGTRTTALAEVGYGITTTVKQYVAIESDASAITKLQLVPAGGVNILNSQPGTGQLTTNASTVWGQNIAGNGGYDSGDNIAADFGKTTASPTVYDETYTEISTGTKVDLITFCGVKDANTARNAGGILCKFNGEGLDLLGASGSLSAADKLKIKNGQYTAWGYERMFRNTAVADKVVAYNALKGAIPANIGTAGLPITTVGAETKMNVSRASDGGTVAP
ncbi:MAG: hypothetical protein WCS43_00840 [Verrucomicrobiota bacterium]